MLNWPGVIVSISRPGGRALINQLVGIGEEGNLDGVIQHLSKLSLFLPGLAGGGAERAMLTLAEGLADRGHDVDLVVTMDSGALSDGVPESVQLVNLEAGRIAASVWPLVQYLRAVRPRALLSALKATNCIAVWANVLSRVDLRLVIVEHNTLSESTRHSRKWRDRLLPQLMRWSYPHADQIIAVSSGVADDLAQSIRYDRDRIDVIYNPVVTPELVDGVEQDIEHPWFSEGAPPVVLGVGRLIRQKDFPNLFHAFARILDKRDARLVILGEGEERGRLEKLASELGISERVDLRGFVSNPYKYMSEAAVFVLSSKWEGFGNVVVEALACGTPVVSTDCPNGPAEILENGRWGHLVPVGDPDKLADAIKAVLSGQGIDGRARAEAFTKSRIVDHYLTTLSPGGA